MKTAQMEAARTKNSGTPLENKGWRYPDKRQCASPKNQALAKYPALAPPGQQHDEGHACPHPDRALNRDIHMVLLSWKWFQLAAEGRKA
jgi:hypothetical protein